MTQEVCLCIAKGPNHWVWKFRLTFEQRKEITDCVLMVPSFYCHLLKYTAEKSQPIKGNLPHALDRRTDTPPQDDCININSSHHYGVWHCTSSTFMPRHAANEKLDEATTAIHLLTSLTKYEKYSNLGCIEFSARVGKVFYTIGAQRAANPIALQL